MAFARQETVLHVGDEHFRINQVTVCLEEGTTVFSIISQAVGKENDLRSQNNSAHQAITDLPGSFINYHPPQV